jgi:hypothetical protein
MNKTSNCHSGIWTSPAVNFLTSFVQFAKFAAALVINFLQHSFSNIKCENKKNLTFSINFFQSRLKLCHIKNVTNHRKIPYI